MQLADFRKKPMMGILRGVELSQLEPLVEVILSSGLEVIEITMNTKDAPQLIRRAVSLSRKRLMIGAGTVLSMDSLRAALESGATFIVTPVLIQDVLRYCVRHKIPVFPGALTPQEIYRAWSEGATMVKVFPANFFGPEYFKEVKGPFGEIELLACGGVTPENLKTYFQNGAAAVAVGASVFKNEWLQEKDFSSIAGLIREYLQQLPKKYAAKNIRR